MRLWKPVAHHESEVSYDGVTGIEPAEELMVALPTVG
jgi:hypothetical protein